MASNANNESISIVREENISSPIRTGVRCKNISEWKRERGEMVPRSTIYYLQDSHVPPVKPGPSISTRVDLIDWKIKVARFPEILSLALVTESWSGHHQEGFGGFWFDASLSEPQPPAEIKNFQQDILWAEMTPLDRWKYCLKM